jgi:tetratricopeptide (TPR) repeat protein
MTSTPLDRNLDAQLDSELEYKALIRSLRYTQGFGLLFVQCSPAEGKRLIAKVRKDLLQKHIEVLSLTEPIETLYDKVETLYRDKPIDVLFVQGIEHSLYDYEKNRLWSDDAQRRSYSETGVPRLLQHLNLSRERFYEDFAFHFVFLVPHFVLKYLTRRAPDFFDWRSGVLEFAMDREQLHQESTQATIGQWQRDDEWDLPPSECRKNLLDIQSLIEEPYQTDARKADLFFEQGRLFAILEESEEAIASYDKVLHFKSDNDVAWYKRGYELDNLGRYEEAIASYDKALQLKPDNDTAWCDRGYTLFKLGCYEEAIASYDKVLQFKPDYDLAWFNRGYALALLGRDEEAIASYDKVLQFKPDYDLAWFNRGYALALLGRDEEAITSYDKALKLKPNNDSAWNHRGMALARLGCYEEAIASYDKALQFKPDNDSAWYNRGFALGNLGRHEEAIANYDKALTLNPNDPRIFYNKACFYALQANFEAAITNLGHAIVLSPEKYREMAKTDSDFDSIRENEDFQALVVG